MDIESFKHVTLVDAHVHIYDCYDLEDLLDAAVTNFYNAASVLGAKSGSTGVLLLSESSGYNYYRQLRDSSIAEPPAGSSSVHRWKFAPLPSGECGLCCTREDGATLLMIAGRQIVTAEGLEVLGLMMDDLIDDGLVIHDVIELVHSAGGVVVLPWGVGKWIGRRGNIITQLIRSSKAEDVFLGDNSGRPIFWNPLHFKEAETFGIRTMPGTDPLPFPSQASKVGGFGFHLNLGLSDTQPVLNLKAALTDRHTCIYPYGALQKMGRFFLDQLHIRVASRTKVHSRLSTLSAQK